MFVPTLSWQSIWFRQQPKSEQGRRKRKKRKKERFAALVWCCAAAGPFVSAPTCYDGGSSVSRAVRKTASFFEFSLCLSRACLGKMIIYIYKWLKNAVFRRGRIGT
jgi:hypothetical protein